MKRAALVVTAAALAACGDAPTPPWHQEAGYRWRDLTVDPKGTPGFTQMAGWKSGIRFKNTVSEATLLGNRFLGQGAGVALGDVDGDGRVDIFLARTEGCSALYHNLGGWRFEDVTKKAGVGMCDRNTTGVAFADVDGDKDLDLIAVSTRGPNAVFLNDGHGLFTERRDLGLETTGKGSTTVALADVDGDGRLDMYVANYMAWSLDDSIPPQQRAFNQVVRQVGPNKYEVAPEHRSYYKIVQRPDVGGTRLTVRASPDDFYRNVGGKFERVSQIGGRFTDAQGKPLVEAPESFGLGAKLVDLNGDGAPDLYVANDFEDTDELWYNDGKGNFRLADWRAQRQLSNSAMGVDVGDVNGDTLPDIFVTDMLANDPRRLKTQMPTHSPFPKKPGDLETTLQQQRNTLFLNRGDGTFAEGAQAAGVSASGWSWGTMMLDVDLDGWQDILVANGHIWDVMDADTQERLQNRLTDINWRRLRWEFPKLALKNVAWRNVGRGQFADASVAWRFGTEEDISHAMAAADLDGDGDLDVVVNRLDATALVLRSESPAPRVAVRLIGDAPNTQAVGAKVKLTGGAQPIQIHEVTAGGLYLSHSDYEMSFAMGRSDEAVIEVEWRDGARTTLRGIKPNRLYEITTATAATPAPLEPTPIATLFEDATRDLGGHVHVDPAFDDWDAQGLLPASLSQLGPGVSWIDLDRDGAEDLVIGAGKTGRIAAFRNDRGRFVALKAPPLAQADVTTILGLPSASGRTMSLVAGASNWEGGDAPGAIGLTTTRTEFSPRVDTLVGPLPFAEGPLALGDYDGDGDLDLFVGGRATARKYPEPTSSRLYRNDGGRFTLDTVASKALEKIGLVSSAMFADMNGDGKPDLVLAREWNSIALLINKGGTFEPAPDAWGLSHWTARWNGVAAGDLDGDGRLDLVATSWGRNTFLPADSANPLFMVYGAFGGNGDEELLTARQDSQARQLRPVNSYPRTRVVIKDLATRISSFGAYANANIDDVLGGAKSLVTHTSVVTEDHMVFLNRGDRFLATSLPAEAQQAPAMYAGIADFDGDGAEDLFLGQNFSATVIGVPRYDAGRGLLLMGDGHGGLTPMSGTRSGIVVYGDQRGVAYSDFNADGRVDLVVSQNAAATRLFRNHGAKPGLRVRLAGPVSNPDGIGSQVRVVYGAGMSPAREVQAGAGYWSENGAVQVFGLSGVPTAIWVRWPGGRETRTPVVAGAREVTVKAP